LQAETTLIIGLFFFSASAMKLSAFAFLSSLFLLPASSYAYTTKVIVGINGELRYEPANFNIAVGDSVMFEFHQKNHSGEIQTFFFFQYFDRSQRLAYQFSRFVDIWLECCGDGLQCNLCYSLTSQIHVCRLPIRLA
jgi:hypothetical protein